MCLSISLEGVINQKVTAKTKKTTSHDMALTMKLKIYLFIKKAY